MTENTAEPKNDKRGMEPTRQEAEWSIGIAASFQSLVESNSLLEMIMPNGKRLADCTGAECAEAGELLKQVGALLSRSMPNTERNTK